jgi:hypothetical protein
MTTQQEAMTKAREALEIERDSIKALMDWCVKNVNKWDFPQFDNLAYSIDKKNEALAALDAVKEPEPALYVQSNHFAQAKFAPFHARICQQPMEGIHCVELYTTAPVQKELINFPPMPVGIVKHDRLGELYDRLQVHKYAMEYAMLYTATPSVKEPEPVYQTYRESDSSWFDSSEKTYLYNLEHGLKVRVLYTTPPSVKEPEPVVKVSDVIIPNTAEGWIAAIDCD